MKKFLKFGKSFVAYAIVFAVLAASLFTGSVISADAASGGKCGGTIVEKWDKVSDGVSGDWYDGTFESGDGTKNNPYIISSAEELTWVCKETTVENSAGVYYKVDPSIKAFDMNTVSGVDLTDDGLTASEVYNKINGKILGKVWHPNYAGCFAGNFDGSGVTIYGLYAGPAYYNQSSLDNNTPFGSPCGGLFGKIDTSTATFKNFTIKNSYFTGDVSGAVFGESSISGGSTLIENVVVANCYIKSTGGATGGVIGGYLRFNEPTNTADKAIINNCLVYDNVVENKTGTAVRLIGSMEAYCDDGSGNKVRDYDGFGISNTIAIGCDIENKGSWWQKDPAFYANCYTTGTPATENTTITKLANAEAAKGAAAATNIIGLDKSLWFFNTNTYPALRVMHDIKFVDNGNGTHTEACDCGLTSGDVSHIFEKGTCSCGAVAKCGEIVSVYSGTPDTTLEGQGTSDNPYLITSADEFAAVALGKIPSTENTYFKVDGIDAFYLNGGAEVAAMTSAQEVKAYFNGKSSQQANVWSASGFFNGKFDGNGVTVYGLYTGSAAAGNKQWFGALFPKVQGGAVIENIALKNSYIEAAEVGGIFATDYQCTVAGTVKIENCMVMNCSFRCDRGSDTDGTKIAGFLGGSLAQSVLKINDCFIAGNECSYRYDDANGLTTDTSYIYSSPNSIKDAAGTVIDTTDITNSIFLDAYVVGRSWYTYHLSDGHVKNVYTDTDLTKFTNKDEANTPEVIAKYVKYITNEDAKGNAAVENITTLSTDWIFNANGYPELRVFHDDELEIAYANNKYLGHIEECSCGLTSPVVAHDYGENYQCIDCRFICDHANADVNISGGDCITAATKTISCSCGYENVSSNGTAGGHTFINKAEVPSADCQTQGTAAHKYCSVCDKNYAVDASETEPFENALSAQDLMLPVAGHTATMDNGKIVYDMSENEHAKICFVCNERFDNEPHQGDFVPNGAAGHSGQCSVCLLETSSEAGHNFGNDNACDDCDWICENHNFVDGTIIEEGDCTTDRVVATACTICGIAGENNVTTAPGHTEGDMVTENEVAADCDTDGSHDEVVYCTVCEEELSRDTVTDEATGHTEGDMVIENEVAADCDTNGSHDEVVYCTVCEEELSRDTVTDEATGHTEGDMVIENEVAADCDTDGSHDEVVYCTVCEEELSRDTITDEATGHNLEAVEEVPATTEKEGTKAHYICECGKLFSDAQGQNEVTEESLIIDKLILEQDKTDDKPEGDDSTTSPVTGEGVVSVVAVAALIGAAFIATKKRK